MTYRCNVKWNKLRCIEPRALVFICLVMIVSGTKPGSTWAQSKVATQIKTIFEAAAIKLDGVADEEIVVSPIRLTMRHAPLSSAIKLAYNIQSYQLVGPDWINFQRYSIFATAGRPVGDGEMREMLRTLLSDRFKLIVRREFRDREMVVMTEGKSGHGLAPSEDAARMVISSEAGRTVFRTTTTTELAAFLSGGGQPTVDMTGLNGRFNFVLNFGRYVDQTVDGRSPMRVHNDALRVAVQEDLGLKLQLKKISVEMFVVDNALEVPTEN